MEKVYVVKVCSVYGEHSETVAVFTTSESAQAYCDMKNPGLADKWSVYCIDEMPLDPQD